MKMILEVTWMMNGVQEEEEEISMRYVHNTTPLVP